MMHLSEYIDIYYKFVTKYSTLLVAILKDVFRQSSTMRLL